MKNELSGNGLYNWLTVGWPAAAWPAPLPTGWETLRFGNASNGPFVLTNEWGSPEPVCEHCDIWMPLTPHIEDISWQRRTADTEVKLATGGPPGSRKMNLWCLSASATAYTNAFDTVGTNVPFDQIQIGSLGNLDTNGELWVLLPDNDPDDVTPRVKGKDKYSFTLPSGEKYTLVHQVTCIALGNTNLDRTTIGIREFVNLRGMPLGTVWTLSGGGLISTNSDSSAQYVAPASPTNATITATYKSIKQSVTFSVIPPSSIVAVAYISNPNGEANANGTLMGEYTSFTDVIGPTNVSFSNVNFRELQSSNDIIIWPDGITNIVRYTMTTNAFQVGCDNTWHDGIGFPFVPTSHLYNGTNYVDYTFSSPWHDQYQDDNGNWVNFASLTATWEFRGSDKKCRVTYLGVSGDWQGPFEEP